MSHTHSRVSLIEEFKHTKIDWVTTLFITIYHVLLFIALPIYLMATSPGWPLIGFTLFLMAGSLLSITTGYHRLYAHRTYRTRKPVEWILVFFGTLATQGSVIRWSHDHRLHHSHLDSEKDPYGTDKGFWHSHLLWMFKDHVPLEERYYRDLKENKLLMFQHKYYGWLMAATNILMIIRRLFDRRLVRRGCDFFSAASFPGASFHLVHQLAGTHVGNKALLHRAFRGE